MQLVHRERSSFERIESPAVPQEPAFTVEEKSGNPLVMVVDDSLTVRELQRLDDAVPNRIGEVAFKVLSDSLNRPVAR